MAQPRCNCRYTCKDSRFQLFRLSDNQNIGVYLTSLCQWNKTWNVDPTGYQCKSKKFLLLKSFLYKLAVVAERFKMSTMFKHSWCLRPRFELHSRHVYLCNGWQVWWNGSLACLSLFPVLCWIRSV